MRQKYDDAFRQQVLEDLGVPAEELQSKLEMAKTSAAKKLGPWQWSMKNAPLLAGTVLGGGLAVGAFGKGVKDAVARSERKVAQKKYLSLLNKLNRARNAQVQLHDIAFTPEEITILETLRKDAGKKSTKKKPKLVGVSETEQSPAASIPANSDNPELKTLLSSI